MEKEPVLKCEECGLRVRSPLPKDELAGAHCYCPKCGKRILPGSTKSSSPSKSGGSKSRTSGKGTVSIKKNKTVTGRTSSAGASRKTVATKSSGPTHKSGAIKSSGLARKIPGATKRSSGIPKTIKLVNRRVIKTTGATTGTAIPANRPKKKDDVVRKCPSCGIRLTSPIPEVELKYADVRCPQCGKKIIL